MKLVNLMEEQVFKAIEKLGESMGDLAQNERARLDVAAYALNQLPPRYAVSHRGEIISRFIVDSPQSQAELVSVIMAGIRHVKANPGNTSHK